MKSQSFTKTILAAGIFAMPLTVLAYPLSVMNLTQSTVSINVAGECSGDFGNINAMTTQTAETKRLESICKGSSANCTAQIINAAGCKGDVIASFNFNTKTKTTGEGSAAAHYSISIQPHRVTISQH